MPVFIAALLGALVSAAGTIVGRVLISLGLGYVVFEGLEASVDWAKAYVIAKISAEGAQTLAAAGALKVGVCINIIFSAITMRLILGGMQSGGVLRKLVHKS